jgi:hypothetical protein
MQRNNTMFQCRWAESLWSDAWKEIKQSFAKSAEESLQQAVLRLDALYADARKKRC